MQLGARVQYLLKSISHSLGIEGLECEDDGTITITVDDQLVCLAFNKSDDGVLLFAPCTDGMLAAPTLLASAMRENFLWKATGGATLAVEPTSGQLVVQQNISLMGLDYPKFAEHLEGFLAVVEKWRTRAAQPDSLESPAVDESSNAFDPRLRV